MPIFVAPSEWVRQLWMRMTLTHFAAPSTLRVSPKPQCVVQRALSRHSQERAPSSAHDDPWLCSISFHGIKFDLCPVHVVPFGDNNVQGKAKFGIDSNWSFWQVSGWSRGCEHSRHTLESPNTVRASSDLVMKNCSTETVLTNPAFSHTVASLAESGRFAISSSRLRADSPRARRSHVWCLVSYEMRPGGTTSDQGSARNSVACSCWPLHPYATAP